MKNESIHVHLVPNNRFGDMRKGYVQNYRMEVVFLNRSRIDQVMTPLLGSYDKTSLSSDNSVFCAFRVWMVRPQEVQFTPHSLRIRMLDSCFAGSGFEEIRVRAVAGYDVWYGVTRVSAWEKGCIEKLLRAKRLEAVVEAISLG